MNSTLNTNSFRRKFAFITFLAFIVIACSRQNKELDEATSGGPRRTHNYSSRGGIVPERADTISYEKRYGVASDDPIVMGDGTIVLKTGSHILRILHDSVVATPRSQDSDRTSLSFEGRQFFLSRSSIIEENKGELVRFTAPPRMFGSLAAWQHHVVFVRSHEAFGATDTLYTYTLDQRKLASFPLAFTRVTSGPIISAEGRVVLGGLHETPGGRDGVVTALELPNTVVWEEQLRFTPQYLSSDDDGNVYVAGARVMIDSSYVGISAFSAGGERRWTRRITEAIGIRSAIAVGKKYLYCICRAGNAMVLLTLDRRDGSLVDSRSVSDASERWSNPVLDPDGNILIASLTRQLLLRFTSSPLGRLFH